ncbi:uncharacterized protein [Eurosta solidaginis]|uniref:uncharacterized protein isoform X2 n=1 Tax=Eurosta solidaginis TaxID=178769 RepID=UPI003530D0F1
MFNLLRRSSKKKKKSTPEKSPKAARYSAREAEKRADCENKTIATRSIERYRSYNEWQRERDIAREKEHALKKQQRELPTQTKTNKKYTRAEIKEFNNLKDLVESEYDYCDDADGARSDESRLANTERKAVFRDDGVAARGERFVYFRSQRVDRERVGIVEENLNLAKTTAANKTTISNAINARKNKQENEQTETVGLRCVMGEGTLATTQPATFRNNDFKLNAFNVDKINKFSAEANKLDVNSVDEDDDDADRYEQDRFERGTNIRDRADFRDCEPSLASHASPNEEVGWQRRFLSFGKTKKSNKNDRFANRSIKDLNQRSKSVYASNGAHTGTGNVKSVVETSASNENRIKSVKGDAFPTGENFIIATHETPNTLSNNEVKYRNLGNLKNTTTTKVQKHTEAKRQSRLSLTLGLNLTGSARSKSITDISTAANRTDSSSVTGAGGVYFSGSRSCSGHRDQPKRSQFGKAFRYSFLRGRSKSSDTETQPYEDDSTNERSAAGALKKSKEFLSDLFMARGRNHNRNRNPQQIHSNHSTTKNSLSQPTQLTHQQQQRVQQKQQQRVQQQQQQQLQTTAKDDHTCIPVGASTSLNSNTQPLHNYQQQNNHNNSLYNSNPIIVMQNVQNNSASTHLEVISDPFGSATNSYQETMSNNSPKNFNRTIDHKERHRRSNSAGEQQLSVSAENNNIRSRSADTCEQQRVSNNDAGVRFENKLFKEDSAAQRLSVAGISECGTIRKVGVDLYGAIKTERTVVDSAKQVNVECETRRNKHTNQSSNNIETVNVFDNESKFEKLEERESVIESVQNSEGKSNQWHNGASICSNANESQRSAQAKITATTQVPKNSETNERETSECPHVAPMGQTSAKPSETAPSTRASATREFQTNISDVNVCVNDEDDNAARVPLLPKITVVDCSSYQSDEDNTVTGSSPMDHDVFYEFENDASAQQHGGVEVFDANEYQAQEADDIDEEDEVFHEEEIPATIYQQKWPLRYNHTKLENVPEQEENEEDRESDGAANGSDSDADSTSDAAMVDDADVIAAATSKVNSANNLDTEYEHSQHFHSSDHGALKSANTSDSNLSTSYPDSGIGGMDSCCSSTSSPSRRHSGSDNETRAARSTKSKSPTMQHHFHNNNNSGNNNYFQQQHQRNAQLSTPHQRSPFARDGNSTDCDDTLLQCDDLEYVAEVDANERLVCIESISLPDVVVESTTGASGTQTSASTSTLSGANGNSNSGCSEQIININGATGNTIGSVHFIPIHVESSDQTTTKRRSVDDSVLGSGGGINKTFAHMNGLHQKSTIEITEDGSELTYDKENGYNNNSSAKDATVEKLRQKLIEQKSRYNTQIGDAQKNVQNLQDKVAGMQAKIEKLEQELSLKAWNVERLQSELEAAHTDDDFVRKRLKLLEEEKTSLRHKYSENEDEFRRKYEELETQYNELEAKYKETKQLASNLQTQLAAAQSEAEEWSKEVEKIRGELEAQITILKNALDNSEAERKICQDKWQKEFEMLRTQNRDREETVMADCEWQLRQIQRQSKEKTDQLERERQMVVERAENLHSELEERKQEVEGLKVYQAEVKSLRGVVAEQEQAIKTLMNQIDNMKGELQTAHTNLEEQMKAVKKIKHQCDSALCDKEREVVYRISEVRNEAAVFWEDKLYTEMTRLKNELEAVYVDERREALDKLQAEHIEELRALTTRYTANEDELRTELNELQERLDRKSEEFIDMRDKSDNNLLQMRMHLDRADREYQNAMCREEERREVLEENLRKEFQAEREEMEEKFRERLNHVKEEFAKELQDATHEMRLQQEKALEQQKAKLQTEKEEALQELSERYRKKLAAVEEKIKEIELRHQHDLKDLKAAYDTEKVAMDRRDISNSNEIEQLHRKCRCLTNLFEEMRMRYERRDPRQEDLREIEELRSRCESQERDLYDLTDRLREMQIQMTAMQTSNGDANSKKIAKQIKKPPPKTIPTSCDVIYEDENEERESPPPQTNATSPTTNIVNNHANDDDEEEEEDEEHNEKKKAFFQVQKGAHKQSRIINRNAKTANHIISSKKLNQKNIDTVNEDDESHMITAM